MNRDRIVEHLATVAITDTVTGMSGLRKTADIAKACEMTTAQAGQLLRKLERDGAVYNYGRFEGLGPSVWWGISDEAPQTAAA